MYREKVRILNCQFRLAYFWQHGGAMRIRSVFGALPLSEFVNFIILRQRRRLMHLNVVILEVYVVFHALPKPVSVATPSGCFNLRHCCQC